MDRQALVREIDREFKIQLFPVTPQEMDAVADYMRENEVTSVSEAVTQYIYINHIEPFKKAGRNYG